jgi:hypothetical protein
MQVHAHRQGACCASFWLTIFLDMVGILVDNSDFSKENQPLVVRCQLSVCLPAGFTPHAPICP